MFRHFNNFGFGHFHGFAFHGHLSPEGFLILLFAFVLVICAVRR